MGKVEQGLSPEHHGLLNSEAFGQQPGWKRGLALVGLKMRYLGDPRARRQIKAYSGSGFETEEARTLRDELTR